VNGEIAEAICGRSFADITAIDEALIAIDGTPDKARLGANALVSVSMAAARAAAVESGIPLWQTLSLREQLRGLPSRISMW